MWQTARKRRVDVSETSALIDIQLTALSLEFPYKERSATSSGLGSNVPRHWLLVPCMIDLDNPVDRTWCKTHKWTYDTLAMNLLARTPAGTQNENEGMAVVAALAAPAVVQLYVIRREQLVRCLELLCGPMPQNTPVSTAVPTSPIRLDGSATLQYNLRHENRTHCRAFQLESAPQVFIMPLKNIFPPMPGPAH